MGTSTEIQWCDATWNIGVGCTKVDAGCKFCYMYRDSLKGTRYDPSVVRKTKQAFTMPLRYKENRSAVRPGSRPLIFTSSLTDFFHPAIDGYRHEAWDIIRRCPHLIFLILTKRPERIMEHVPADWGQGWNNVWIGTSVGSEESLHRAGTLAGSVEAKVKFLSL